MNIRIGARSSPLALNQIDEVRTLLTARVPELRFEIVAFTTRGDADKNTPIDMMEGSGFFTDTIRKALSEGTIDAAIHSAKDLPDESAEGLTVYLCGGSIDPDDVLVSGSNVLFKDLREGAVIGTSSARRKEQLLKARNDLSIRDIRGNIGERLAILDSGKLDGMVIAAAGLVRLGLSDRITERLKFMEPHPLQGVLAFEIQSGNTRLENIAGTMPGWKRWHGAV